MKILDVLAAVLLVIGGWNWGIIGLSGVNVVEMLLKEIPLLVKGIYLLVGLSAVYQTFQWKAIQNRWK
jgi:uncharacterized membrane protein YuzA (DUF378 family)